MGVKTDLLEWALAYADLGWKVVPLHTPEPVKNCSCRNPKCSSPGKHPRTQHGLKDATTDKATIKGWWALWPYANIGVVTGETSGIVVIDLDPRHSGFENWERFTAEHGRVRTLTVITGGGGKHLIFESPQGESLKSTSGKIAPGIDTKADGGYIVAPPSLHQSGQRYRWQEKAE